MSKFIIDISDLLDKRVTQKELHLVQKMDTIKRGEEQFSFSKPLELNIRLETVLSGILAKGFANTEIVATCSRCLSEVYLDLSLEIEEVFVHTKKQAELFMGKEEAEEVYFIEDSTINLEPALNQAVILSLPIKPLCSSACKGLCPKCGQNLNIKKCDCKVEQINVRMEELKKLFEKKESSSE